MKIAFVWQGITGRYGQWKDGLWAAMRRIEKIHEVRYFEPTDDIESYNPDWLLLWEAPITYQSKDHGDWYKKVVSLPFRKAMLFAGGEIQPMWIQGFDHIFVESQIDADTCERLGVSHSRAFGYNEEIFRPQRQPKVWDGIHQCTCASWKRTWLMTEALKDKSLICGRYQESDPNCWIKARDHHAMVLPELPPEAVCSLLNASRTMVQTSGFWGGGQRATLEAIACGIPVIAMSDSPKNCEFVRSSNFGIICEPNVESIKQTVEEVKNKHWDLIDSMKYVEKWTSEKYANDILKVIG